MLVGGQRREGTGKSPGQGLSHLVQSPLPTLRVHLSSKFECSEFILGKMAFFLWKIQQVHSSDQEAHKREIDISVY